MILEKFLKFPRILILLLLISFASISAVIFTPSLPSLAESFAISEAKAQWTISLFLIGYALGQLPYGPLANRFGRKKAIYLGIGLAICGLFISYFSDSFWMLCLGRFVQAVGSSVGFKIAFTMINDTQRKEDAAKALSLLMLAFVIMPAIGVAIGGFITVLWGWKGNIVFLGFYSVFLGLLSLTLPETAKQLDPNALQWRKIIRGYGRQFRDLHLVLYALLGGLTTALLYVFATLAPYVGILDIGMTPDKFGLWSFIPYSGLFFGILLTHRIAGNQKPQGAILSGILLALAGILAMAICFTNGWLNPWTLFLPMFAVQMGDSLIYTFASTSGVSESSDKSNASAVLQFITMAVATASIYLVGFVPPTHALLIPSSLGIIAIVMLLIWLTLRFLHGR